MRSAVLGQRVLGVLVDKHGELNMLGKWTEIVPLFVVRWLALRYCKRFYFKTSPELRVAMPRPDVLVKLPAMPAMGCAETGESDKDPAGCWNVRCQLGKRCCRAVDA